MKNKIFSLRLYLEGLRQTKVIGIVLTAILLLQVILVPVGRYFESMLFYYMPENTILNFDDLNPMLYIMIYIGAPLFVLYTFSFLNKRKSADFYHSLACSRICLFLSYFAAICTYLVTICSLTTVISILINVIIPQSAIFNNADIWITLLNIIVNCIYSASVVALAMGLTGRLFSNIVLSWVFLNLPNFVISLFGDFVTSNLSIIPYGSYSISFLPVAFNSSQLSYTDVNSIIYTLILSIIILALAMIAFKFRKSENAGSPAINKYLNAGIRIALCMIFCIFACNIIFSYFISTEFYYFELFFAIIIYVIALIAYFLYEIITTKSFRTIPRTLPSLLIVVVLNIAFIFSMKMVYDSYLSFCPEASEIEYVKVNYDDNLLYDFDDYLKLTSEEVKLNDDEIKEIVANSLSEEIKYISTREYYYSDYSIDVIISVNGKEHLRSIDTSEPEYNKIMRAVANNESYRGTNITLPEAVSATIETDDGTEVKITDEESLRIYNFLREEASGYSYDQWKGATDIPSKSSIILCNIYVTVDYEGSYYSFVIPLSSEFTKAASEYARLTYSEKNSNEILKRLTNKPDALEEISVSFFNTNKYSDMIHYAYDEKSDIPKRMLTLFEHIEAVDSINSEDVYAVIYILDEQDYDHSENDIYYEESYSAIFRYTGNQ